MSLMILNIYLSLVLIKFKIKYLIRKWIFLYENKKVNLSYKIFIKILMKKSLMIAILTLNNNFV